MSRAGSTRDFFRLWPRFAIGPGNPGTRSPRPGDDAVYLLDTNIVSKVLHRRSDPRVIARLRQTQKKIADPAKCIDRTIGP
jgi:hypothetical protein